MATPYIADLMCISWNYAPKAWAFCNGQTLAINQNQALFSLLGTTFGGNGQTTFLLPNLQGRVPVGAGAGFTLGQVGGEINHTLTQAELPTHNHQLMVSNASSGFLPKVSNNAPGITPASSPLYAAPQNLVAMNPAVLSNAGGSQPHENEQPYLVLNWIIALQGIFPSRN